MLFLGGGDLEDAFDQPFNEALPLADKPHLLKPKATKEELFGRASRGEIKTCPAASCLPDHMSLMHRVNDNQKTWPGGLTPSSCTTDPSTSHSSLFTGLTGIKVEPDALLSRWRKSVELFARVFMDDVGSEDGSVLRQLASFTLRQNKFQKQMEELLRSAKNNELNLNVNRQREKLIPQTVKKLNQEFTKIKEDQAKYRKVDSFKSSANISSRHSHGAARTDNLLITRKIKVIIK